MRKTIEELWEYVPVRSSWSDEKFISVFYGDIPHHTVTEPTKYTPLDESMAQWRYGDFDVYRSDGMKIWITKDGRVLNADISYRHRGNMYTIFYIDMYGSKPAFTMYRILAGGVVKCVIDNGEAWSSIDEDIVKAILYDPMPDYGVGVQTAFNKFREIYEECVKNKKIKFE